jgi:hypothetical protein
MALFSTNILKGIVAYQHNQPLMLGIENYVLGTFNIFHSSLFDLRPEAKPGETAYIFENSGDNTDFKPSWKVFDFCYL